MTLSSLFWKLVSMSLAASVLILLVAALRPLLKRLPKRLPCILWAACLVRLLCPFTFKGSFSLIPRAVSSLADGVTGGAESAVLAAEQAAQTVSDALGGASASGGGALASADGAIASAPSFLSLLPYLWLAGVAAFLVYAVVSLLKIHRMLRNRIAVDAADFVETANVRVYVVPGLGSAFCRGVFRPAIYLPEGLSDAEARCVTAHEAAHLRRKDPLLKAIAFGALCIHWANPLVWLLFRLLGADMEMAADEAVLAHDNGFAKADYSQVILNCAAGRTGLPMGTLAFGSGNVRTRIRNVLRFRRLPRYAVTAVTLLALVVGLTMLWDVPATVAPNVSELAAEPVSSITHTVPEQETLPTVPARPLTGEEEIMNDTSDDPGTQAVTAPVETIAPPVETVAPSVTPAPVETVAPVEESETAEQPAVSETPAGTKTVVIVNLKNLKKEEPDAQE